MPTTPNSESSAAVANFIFRGVKRMPPPKPPRQRNRPQSLPATHVLELHAKEKQLATRGSTSSDDTLPTPRDDLESPWSPSPSVPLCPWADNEVTVPQSKPVQRFSLGDIRKE